MQDNAQNIRKSEDDGAVNSKSEKSVYKSTGELQTTADTKRKNVVRILEFHEDNTFSEYLPAK
jgi:hypothetical protein